MPGYERALRLRDLLPERPAVLRDLRRLIEDRFDILVLRHTFEDGRILGAACRSGRARLIAVNVDQASETARRFVLAHELGHHLFDLEESGATADEGDLRRANAWFDTPPREKRANAFAAMLLAPGAAIRELAGGPRASTYETAKALVESVRKKLGLGYAAAAWHLHNLEYFDRRMAETLLLVEPDVDRTQGLEDEGAFDGLARRVFQALSSEAISLSRARELIGHEADRFVAA